MPRKAANKTKAWRREKEIHMMPQEIDTVNEAGETVKSVQMVPYILKGRMLRDYRRMGRSTAPMASNLLINLMSSAGFVTMVNDVVASEANETTVETV